MKIYEFKYKTGETDWIFASGKKEAIEFYLRYTGCGDLDGCTVKVIHKNEWGNHFILDLNETEPDPDEIDYDEEDYCNGYKIEMSFKEYAEQNTQTDIICTTEF